MENNAFKQKYESAFKTHLNRKRSCLIDGCDEIAIKSHTLQKNGILKQISNNNHLYQFGNTSLFDFEEKGRHELKKIGINNVYTFPGYCKFHDTSVFKNIETKDFDVKLDSSIKLFSYRALCQEIRRKEIILDVTTEMINFCDTLDSYFMFSQFKIGLVNGIENLYFFKSEFEKDIKNSDPKNNNFNYKICEIPEIEICISAPLNIFDENNKYSMLEEENSQELKKVFSTSVFNIFPLNGKSYVMMATHKKYYCNWSENIFRKFMNNKTNQYQKILSDFVATRVEFWCLSPKLKHRIGEEKIKKLFEKWKKETLNFEFIIKNELNIFQ